MIKINQYNKNVHSENLVVQQATCTSIASYYKYIYTLYLVPHDQAALSSMVTMTKIQTVRVLTRETVGGAPPVRIVGTASV